VNLSVDKTPVDVAAGYGIAKGRPSHAYMMVAAMPVYSILLYAIAPSDAGSGISWLAATVSYFLAVYVYFGIAFLAFEGRTHLLWMGGTAGIAVGCVLSGVSGVWPTLLGWGMVLSAGVICGRLIAVRRRASHVYIAGLVAVVVFFTAQYASLWMELMSMSSEAAEMTEGDLEQMLLALGYSPELARDSLENVKRVFEAIVRITPSLTVMSALLQYSLGFLLFLRFAGRRDPSLACAVPFIEWRVPFGVTPVLIVTILLRILGGESLEIVADNVIVCLSVYYCLAGLSLMEYFLRRLRLSGLVKIVFYVLLFITQVVGFFVAALLGFVDSFADWRKRPAAETV